MFFKSKSFKLKTKSRTFKLLSTFFLLLVLLVGLYLVRQKQNLNSSAASVSCKTCLKNADKSKECDSICKPAVKLGCRSDKECKDSGRGNVCRQGVCKTVGRISDLFCKPNEVRISDCTTSIGVPGKVSEKCLSGVKWITVPGKSCVPSFTSRKSCTIKNNVIFDENGQKVNMSGSLQTGYLSGYCIIGSTKVDKNEFLICEDASYSLKNICGNIGTWQVDNGSLYPNTESLKVLCDNDSQCKSIPGSTEGSLCYFGTCYNSRSRESCRKYTDKSACIKSYWTKVVGQGTPLETSVKERCIWYTPENMPDVCGAEY